MPKHDPLIAGRPQQIKSSKIRAYAAGRRAFSLGEAVNLCPKGEADHREAWVDGLTDSRFETEGKL